MVVESDSEKVQPQIESLGNLNVDTGDVVCFSSDAVLKMMDALGEEVGSYKSLEAFISRFEGVACQLNADGHYSVEKLTQVRNNDYETEGIVVIGLGMNRFLRFLHEREPTFRAFCNDHPLKDRVGTGEEFDENVFNQIVQDYRRKLAENASD